MACGGLLCVEAVFQAKGKVLPDEVAPLELVSNGVLREFLDDRELMEELNFMRLLYTNARNQRVSVQSAM